MARPTGHDSDKEVIIREDFPFVPSMELKVALQKLTKRNILKLAQEIRAYGCAEYNRAVMGRKNA